MLNVQVEIQGAFALFDRIFEYLDLPIEIADRAGAIALDPARVQGEVAFNHVSFRYPDAPPRPDAASGDAGAKPRRLKLADGDVRRRVAIGEPAPRRRSH